MRIYYTHAVVDFFKISQKEASTLSDRVQSFLNPDEALAANASGGQSEQFLSETIEGFHINWVGIRINKRGRLIGAVVRNTETETPARHFFALEFTPTHDYQKTLVENPQRLSNWRNYIVEFLKTLPVIEEPVTPSNEAQRLVQHQGRYRVADVVQARLIDIPIREGAVCFGAPGAGKTLVAADRTRRYAELELKAITISPTGTLADEMQEELIRQGVDTEKLGMAFWNVDRFLAAMQPHYPDLTLVHNKDTAKQQYVDFQYFTKWYRALKKVNKASDIELMTFWQEFCYVLMQPNWEKPDCDFLSEKLYCALGRSQSNILQEHRPALYQNIFRPFFTKVQDTSQCYFPPYVAHQLYNALLTTPLHQDNKFDALVLDEVQKFHPWQWACLLTLLKKPLSAGQFFICGDAYQGVEAQQLRVAETLYRYFEKAKATVTTYHLSVNHRSSQAVNRFVGKIHALELTLLGSIERDTHVHHHANTHEGPGRVLLTQYTAPLRTQIANNANAYVLIPHETCQASAEQQWPRHQIVTLTEFTGMSAETIVIHGFSAYYKVALDTINSMLPEDSDFLFSKEDAPYARKSKGQFLETLPVLRACFQAIYTAASRARDTLLLTEKSGDPHLLFKKMCEQQAPVAKHSVESGASAAPVPTLSAAAPAAAANVQNISTPIQWFERAKHDYNQNLKDQAIKTLLDKKIWGADKVALVNSLIKSNPDDLFASLKPILFPEKITAPSKPLKVVPARAETSAAPAARLAAKPDDTYIAPPAEVSKPSNVVPARAKTSAATAAHLAAKPDDTYITLPAAVSKPSNVVPVRAKTSATTAALLPKAPLSDKFKEYLENLLRPENLNKENIKNFFNIKKMSLTQVLFDHKMQNDQCFLVAIVANGHSRLFYDCINLFPGKLDNLTKEYNDFISNDDLLPLCWYSVIFSEQQEKLHEKINEVASDSIRLCNLLSKETGVKFFKHHWDIFTAKNKIAKTIHNEVLNSGTTAFFWLTCYSEGQQLIIDKWDDFVAKRLLSPQSMHKVVTSDGRFKGTTPFFLLTGRPESQKLIIAKWGEFVTMGLLSPQSMHNVVTAKGNLEGTTAFFWLSYLPDGRNLIINKWDEFLNMGLLSSKSMHHVVTADNSRYKGTTPFFWFTCYPESRKLIINKWDDFLANSLFSPKSMHEAATGDGPDTGTTAFFWIVSSTEGQQLIFDKWDDFVTNGLLSPKSMHRDVTGDGPHKGATPFLYLACTDVGQKLIIAKWGEFVARGLLSTQSMHRFFTANGPDADRPHKGKTPFFWLTCSPGGRRLIIDNWNFFLVNGLLSPKSMHHVVTADDNGYTYKGTTPFLMLTASPEGRQLIIEKWDDFLVNGLLSPESMHHVVTADNSRYKGATPFFMLASCPQGLQLIITKWKDFMANDLASHKSMHQEVTADGHYRGTTPFFYLSGCRQSQQLIIDNWVYFVDKQLILPESMHKIVADGRYKGTTPFFFLAGSRVGRKLIIDKWQEFMAMGLFSPESIEQEVTADGPYKGATPLSKLLQSPEGEQFRMLFSQSGFLKPQFMKPLDTSAKSSQEKTVEDTLTLCEELSERPPTTESVAAMITRHGLYRPPQNGREPGNHDDRRCSRNS